MKKTLMRTITVTFVILITYLVGAGQTSDDLKQRYGMPDEKGHYLVRPGITLLVTNTKDQKPSYITIEPGDVFVSGSHEQDRDGSAKVMPSNIAEQVLEEILPIEKRGRPGKGGGTIVSGCTILSSIDYEFLAINISKRCPEQGAGTYQITIHWKEKKDFGR